MLPLLCSGMIYLSFLQLSFDGMLEPGEVSLIQLRPIYENRRRSLNSALNTIIYIAINQGRYPRVFQILIKLIHLQPNPFSNLVNLSIAEFPLIGIKFAMHFPKLSLPIRRQCSDRCLSGIRVAGKGKVLDNQFNLIRISFQHLLEKRLKAPAVGSLIIRKHSDGYRSLLRTFERVSCNVDFENGLNEDNLQGLIRTTRNRQHIAPGQ